MRVGVWCAAAKGMARVPQQQVTQSDAIGIPVLQATQDAGEAAQVRAGVGLLGDAPAAEGGWGRLPPTWYIAPRARGALKLGIGCLGSGMLLTGRPCACVVVLCRWARTTCCRTRTLCSW